MIMVIAIIISNNKSTKVDLWTEQHHRTKNKKKRNRQTRYLSGKHAKKLFYC